MFAAANFSHDVGSLNSAVAETVLHIQARANFFAGGEPAFQLSLIFRSEGKNGNSEFGFKAKNTGVGKIHAFAFESALAAKNCNRAVFACQLYEITKLRKHGSAVFFGLAFGDNQKNFPRKSGRGFHFFVEVENIDGDDVGFRASGGRGTGPAHGIDGEAALRGFGQRGLRGAARPPAPQLKIFGMDIFQADGAHLGETPLDGFLRLRRAGDASADFIAQLRQILEGVRLDQSFAGNSDQGGAGGVDFGILGDGAARAEGESRRQSCRDHENASHGDFSP